jgi:hypothetical protein
MLRRVRRPPRSCRRQLNLEALEDRLAPSVQLGQQPGAPDTTQFHGDPARAGFNQNETFLTPANVASGFGQVWQSPVLDGHLYASPLYQDSVLIQGNGNAANHAGDGVQSQSFQGKVLGVVFAATGGSTLYAIAAQDTNGTTGIAPGTVLWKAHLGNPYGGIDGNSIGVLSTPIIDVASNRIYVTAAVTDYLLPAGDPNHGGNNWEVFALNLSDGSLVTGWHPYLPLVPAHLAAVLRLDGRLLALRRLDFLPPPERVVAAAMMQSPRRHSAQALEPGAGAGYPAA